MSRCSTSAARRPRLVASRSAPTPTIPPPTMRTSNCSSASDSSAARRHAGSVERSAITPLRPGCPAPRCPPRPPPRRSGQGSGGRRGGDSPQDEPGAEDQHADQERRVEDHALGVGREHGRENRRSEHDTDGRARDEQDLAPADRPERGQPRSASRGMPIGATRTLPARAAPRRVSKPGLRSMEGHREVGPDDRVGRVARGQVDRRRRIDRDDRDLRGPGPRARARRPSGSGRAARRGRPSRAGHRRRSTPGRCPCRAPSARARSRHGCGATRGSRSRRFQLRVRVRRRRLRRVETRTAITSAPARARWRAATNPSPPLLPGPHRIRIGPFRHRPVASAIALTAAATAAPACSISRWPGTPSFCARRSAPVICLGADRRARGRRRPAPPQPAQVELEQLRIVGRQRGRRIGRGQRGGGAHARSVSNRSAGPTQRRAR